MGSRDRPGGFLHRRVRIEPASWENRVPELMTSDVFRLFLNHFNMRFLQQTWSQLDAAVVKFTVLCFLFSRWGGGVFPSMHQEASTLKRRHKCNYTVKEDVIQNRTF